jgi:hypothetical protein
MKQTKTIRLYRKDLEKLRFFSDKLFITQNKIIEEALKLYYKEIDKNV